VPVEITALAFDTKQDIIWSGTRKVGIFIFQLTAQGRVVGFAGPSLISYTSWFGHADEVRDLLVHDRGVVSLGPRNVRVTHRRGLQRWDIRYVF
jgi:PAB-dependent poly(A)-specific ribonuclease subunit 2